MSYHALLLVNRHARQGQKRYEEAINCLHQLGLKIITESTENPTKRIAGRLGAASL